MLTYDMFPRLMFWVLLKKYFSLYSEHPVDKSLQGKEPMCTRNARNIGLQCIMGHQVLLSDYVHQSWPFISKFVFLFCSQIYCHPAKIRQKLGFGVYIGHYWAIKTWVPKGQFCILGSSGQLCQ